MAGRGERVTTVTTAGIATSTVAFLARGSADILGTVGNSVYTFSTVCLYPFVRLVNIIANDHDGMN